MTSKADVPGTYRGFAIWHERAPMDQEGYTACGRKGDIHLSRFSLDDSADAQLRQAIDDHVDCKDIIDDIAKTLACFTPANKNHSGE